MFERIDLRFDDEMSMQKRIDAAKVMDRTITEISLQNGRDRDLVHYQMVERLSPKVDVALAVWEATGPNTLLGHAVGIIKGRALLNGIALQVENILRHGHRMDIQTAHFRVNDERHAERLYRFIGDGLPEMLAKEPFGRPFKMPA